MNRLRLERVDRQTVEECYRVIRINARMTPRTVLAILRVTVPRVSIHRRDHLIALRRRVEFEGRDETPIDPITDAEFDAEHHVLHVPDKSHLDLLTQSDGILLGAELRRGCTNGVLLWWP